MPSHSPEHWLYPWVQCKYSLVNRPLAVLTYALKFKHLMSRAVEILIYIYLPVYSPISWMIFYTLGVSMNILQAVGL